MGLKGRLDHVLWLMKCMHFWRLETQQRILHGLDWSLEHFAFR